MMLSREILRLTVTALLLLLTAGAVVEYEWNIRHRISRPPLVSVGLRVGSTLSLSCS